MLTRSFQSWSLFLLSLVACGGTVTSNTTDGGDDDGKSAMKSDASSPGSDARPSDSSPGDTSMGESCLSMCEAKAASCGAPADSATKDCAAICMHTPTPTQLSCLESSSCSTLASAFESNGTVCGIGEPTDAGSHD
jgi:hypothetical protein